MLRKGIHNRGPIPCHDLRLGTLRRVRLADYLHAQRVELGLSCTLLLCKPRGRYLEGLIGCRSVFVHP
jgi:hypothetical protein